MLKKTQFGNGTKTSKKALKDRITYMSDVTHNNHLGKTILAARNYRCDDQSGEAFETKALELFTRYRKGRDGKVGKRTKKLFEEFIYSSAPNSFLADKEKKLVEKAIIDNGFPFTSCRTVWHDDPQTGRSDLHILSAGYTDDIPPRCHLSTDFGHGKRDFLLTLERAERDALDEINEKREPSKRVLSAREKKKLNMREAKVQSLAEKLAEVWDGGKDSLRKALEKLNYNITKVTAENISVLSPGKKKPKRYNIETLRENVEDIYLEKEMTMEKEPEVKTPDRSVSRATKVDKWKKKYPEKKADLDEGFDEPLVLEDEPTAKPDPAPPETQKKEPKGKPQKPNKDEPPPI